jgi:DnaJ-domain-containing protein 1
MPVKFFGNIPEPTSHLGQKGPTQLQKELRIHEQLILEQTELHKKIKVLSVELHNIWLENSRLQYLYSNTNVHEPIDLPNTTLEFNNMTLRNPSAYSTLEAKVENLHTANENIRRGNIELANVLHDMGLDKQGLRDQNTELHRLLSERNALNQRLRNAELQWGQKQSDAGYPIENVKSGLDPKAYENMNNEKEKKKQHDIGPCREDNNWYIMRNWALKTLNMEEKDMYNLQTIKTNFKRLAKKYHPDKNAGDIRSEEIFKWVTAANEWLSNGGMKKEISIPIESIFNFSGLPLGFQQNKYFVQLS